MDNQHRKITGYRELSQEEIDLMNEVKALGEQLRVLHLKAWEHVQKQWGDSNKDPELLRHLSSSHPDDWLESGRMDLQKGLMALTRAIAQPETF